MKGNNSIRKIFTNQLSEVIVEIHITYVNVRHNSKTKIIGEAMSIDIWSARLTSNKCNFAKVHRNWCLPTTVD